MDNLLEEGVLFETKDDVELDTDDFEEDLEKEVNDMMAVWDRSLLLREVNTKRGTFNLNKDVEYYDGKTDFAHMKENMEPLVGNQVFMKILKKNTEGHQIDGTHSVLFEKVGYLECSETPFESSHYDGRPCKLNLTEGPILPGLLQALLSLREGEKAEILIHPAMAYGPLGSPPIIPGDAWLLYYVKIYKTWSESHLESVIKYERDFLVEIPLEHKLKLIDEHKQVANNYVRDGLPREALVRYKAAIKCLDEIPEEDLKESPQLTKILINLLVNAAITYNKLDMPKSASKAAKRTLYLDPNNIKAYYQLIHARLIIGDYEKALNWLDKADKLFPKNPNLDSLRLKLDSKIKVDHKKRLETLKRMSKGLFSQGN